ncbi:hypothetical protein SEA_BIG4_247 [Microbacterium phage Big4]|nr:hypothetical protein SEA_BIG4_247 [Microbacterium phage Big4]
MSDGPKTLTGSARLAVVDEAPAGSVQFTFSPDSRVLMFSCDKPFITDAEPLDNWRRLVDKTE